MQDCLFARQLDAGMEKSVCDLPGSGAAGGLGYAHAVLGGRMVSGAQAVASHIGLAKAVADADWVLTGEGRSDSQTLSGKAPACVAAWPDRQACLSVCCLAPSLRTMRRLAAAFDGCYSLCNRPMALDVAMQEAARLIAGQAEQLARTILAAHAIPKRSAV
jgi:glycerate kinase